MKLIRIDIRNFMSIQSFQIDLNAFAGKPLILFGQIGAGKSSLLESVRWCLTGKTHRALTGDSVKRRGADKEETAVVCTVETQDGLDVEVERFRGRNGDKKNGLTFRLNGAEQKDKGQEHLFDLLGFSELSLLSAMYFGQGASGVSSLTDSKLKEVLESVLDFSEFQDALDIAKREAIKQREDLRNVRFQSSEALRALQALNAEVKSLKRDSRDTSNDRSVEIRLMLSLVRSGIVHQLKIIGGKLTLIEEQARALQKVQMSIRSVEGQQEQVEKEEERVTSLLSKNRCPTCQQKMSGAKPDLTKARFMLNAEMRVLSDENSALLKTIAKEAEALRKERVALSKCKESEHELRWLTHELDLAQARIAERLKAAKKSLAWFKDQIEAKLKERVALIKKEDRIQRRLEEAEFWVRGFGPSGLRDHALRSVLPIVNQVVQGYLDRFAPVPMEVLFRSQRLKSGEEKTGKIEVAVRKPEGFVELDSCSGGERRCVDIALAFALGDITFCGTLLFDEWFDALDEQTTGQVHAVLESIAQSRTVIIATHNERFQPTHFVSKSGSTTTITEV